MFRSLAILACFSFTSVTGALASDAGNPAAGFCVEQGGTYEIVEDTEGQRGLCNLSDGRRVDAWDFFRDQHSPSEQPGQQTADRIWTGGPSLTMVDGAMRAEALAERDGVILGVGPTDQVLALKGPDTQMIDLAGRTLIPGFVDAHGHVFMIGIQALSANMLPAPDGLVNDIAAMTRIGR